MGLAVTQVAYSFRLFVDFGDSLCLMVSAKIVNIQNIFDEEFDSEISDSEEEIGEEEFFFNNVSADSDSDHEENKIDMDFDIMLSEESEERWFISKDDNEIWRSQALQCAQGRNKAWNILKENEAFPPNREFLETCNDYAVTIVEQLVTYKCMCPFRQYIPTKSGKYGLKFWMLCDSNTSYDWKSNYTLEKTWMQAGVQPRGKGCEGPGCHTTWDGIHCWPRSKPGELAVAPCPEYISGFDSKENATKFCTKNGWWVKQDLNVTWTNYTGCYHNTPHFGLPPFDVQLPTSPMVKSYIPTVKLISQIGYSVSLITLLLAFGILAFNKRLRCPRNLLHLHLFVSFIMRAFMALLKDNLFVEGVGFRHNVFYLDGEVVFTFLYHKWECKIFMVFWQYFIMANYSWILMEGIYLHNLTFMAMFFDTSSIFWHVATGWTLPSVFVIPWAVVRAFYEDTFCWTTHANKIYFYIIKTPIIVSILVNLILFINIIRVLLKKLNSTTPLFLETRISRYRKWAKSTLILMPLYGVHYALLLGMSYSDDPTIEIVWLICDQLFGSSQGFCVALLYCILNGEVMNEMSRKWFLFKKEINSSKLRKNFSFQSKETVNLGVRDVKRSFDKTHASTC